MVPNLILNWAGVLSFSSQLSLTISPFHIFHSHSPLSPFSPSFESCLPPPSLPVRPLPSFPALLHFCYGSIRYYSRAQLPRTIPRLLSLARIVRTTGILFCARERAKVLTKAVFASFPHLQGPGSRKLELAESPPYAEFALCNKLGRRKEGGRGSFEAVPTSHSHSLGNQVL